MDPSTSITLGFCTLLATVVGGCWVVFKYIGGIEKKIDRNTADINNLFEQLRQTKVNTAKYINENTHHVNDIEVFLQNDSDYHIRTKTLISEKDL